MPRRLEISAQRPLRIGILGAARIAPNALVEPARERPDVLVAAVAARDPERARAFAAEHGIERVPQSYDELVRDPELDAIFNPLANSLHAPWTLGALAQGKHVLCEKPFACNAAEARSMVEAARTADLLLMEAFHYAYHPLTQRWRELLRQGAIGEIVRVSASFRTSIPTTDFRYDYALGGGATMDLGCYCIHAVRLAVGEEPEVTSASAVTGPPDIDVELEAALAFPGGAQGKIASGMNLSQGFRGSLTIEGKTGQITIDNPTLPHLGHRLRVDSPSLALDEEVAGRTSYAHQLDAFVDALRTGEPPLTSGEDAISNMRVIDAAYAAAGLPLRGKL